MSDNLSVVIKEVHPILVAFEKGKGLSNFDKIESKLKEKILSERIPIAGPTIGLFYNDPAEVGPESVEFEVCIPVARKGTAFETKKLTLGKVAYKIHVGDVSTIDQTITELISSLKQDNIKFDFPLFERYIDDEHTEVGFSIY